MAIRDRFDLVIFDWAGTMVDFGCQAPVIALREAFSRHAVAISESQARRDMGMAKAQHVRALLQDPLVAKAWREAHGAAAGEADVEALMLDLGPLMRDQAARAARLIDGARITVDALRAEGIKVASSTGYTREMMGPRGARSRGTGVYARPLGVFRGDAGGPPESAHDLQGMCRARRLAARSRSESR